MTAGLNTIKEKEHLLENQHLEPDLCKKSGKVAWVSAYVLVASLVILSHGIFFATSGPMLQYLVINTRSSVGLVAVAVSGSGVGVFTGSLVFSAVKSALDYKKPLVCSGISVFVISLVEVCTPFIHQTIQLVILYAVCGFVHGYSGAELQSVYLKRWGQVDARPYIQLHHLMYAVGSLVASLLAKPFLEMASLRDEPITACPSSGANESMLTSVSNHSESSTLFEDGGHEISNPISWYFFILGGFSIIIALLCLILTVCNVEDHLVQYLGKRADPETRPEGRFSDLWMFLLAVMLFKFCVVSSELIYQGYIYSIAICSDLTMNITNASLLNSLFWAGFVLGRVACVFISRYLKPSTILIADLIASGSALVILGVWGEHSPAITWTVTFLFAFFGAPRYPTAVCWSSEVTNMTGKYIFVFGTGGTIGWAITQPIAGVLFEIYPFSVVYFVTGLCVVINLFYILMVFTARHYHRKSGFKMRKG